VNKSPRRPSAARDKSAPAAANEQLQSRLRRFSRPSASPASTFSSGVALCRRTMISITVRRKEILHRRQRRRPGFTALERLGGSVVVDGSLQRTGLPVRVLGDAPLCKMGMPFLKHRAQGCGLKRERQVQKDVARHRHVSGTRRSLRRGPPSIRAHAGSRKKAAIIE